MATDELGELDDPTVETVVEHPFDGEDAITGEYEPNESGETTAPTRAAPLPIGFGPDDDESTAALGTAHPATDVEILAPEMRGHAPEPRAVSAISLLVGAFVLVVLLCAGVLGFAYS